MCQASEGEGRFLAAMERDERQRKWKAHLSGEEPLSKDELHKMAVEALMERDAGY